MNSHANIKPLIEQMKAAGHRITPQRQAILEILITSDVHPTVDQIYDQVKIDFPMTSRATVYKTISLAKALGAVLELEFSQGSNRYDGKRPYSHPHVICTICGQVLDADVFEVTSLQQQIIQKTGYRIINHRMDFFGVCPQCQKTKCQTYQPKKEETNGRIKRESNRTEPA